MLGQWPYSNHGDHTGVDNTLHKVRVLSLPWDGDHHPPYKPSRPSKSKNFHFFQVPFLLSNAWYWGACSSISSFSSNCTSCTSNCVTIKYQLTFLGEPLWACTNGTFGGTLVPRWGGRPTTATSLHAEPTAGWLHEGAGAGVSTDEGRLRWNWRVHYGKREGFTSMTES